MQDLICIIPLLLALVSAQVQVKGRYQETVQQLFFAKKQPNRGIPVYRSEKRVSNAQEVAKELETPRGRTKPYRFAESVPVSLNIANAGTWEEIQALDGKKLKIWQAIVTSDDAVSLSAQFDEFHLSEDAELYIRGRESMHGAFTPEVNNQADGQFATAPITGDFLAFLVAVPVGKDISGLRLKVKSLAHGFRPIPKDFEDSASCNIDVACKPQATYANQIRAVAMLMLGDGTRFCSGTMINNSSKNKRQLFLTAHHCLISTPSNYVAIFNYQRPLCNNTNIEPSTLQSARGMRLLATWAQSDFALLEIVETIPNNYKTYLAGWNMNKTPANHVYGIHHPSCDVKKISLYNSTLVASYWTESPRTYHWMVTQWTEGTTEPGSSGSGLFNSNGQLIGQLHGGMAACDNPQGYDLYGALAYSWTGGSTASTRLRDYLNPKNLWISSLAGMELQR